MGTVIIQGLSERGYQELESDGKTRYLVGIDAGHHKIHEGDHFLASRRVVKGDTEVEEILIDTPNTNEEAHMTIIIKASAAADVDVFRFSGKDYVGANALLTINRNQNSDETPTTKTCHTPGGSGPGEQIFEAYVGANEGPVKIGGEVRGDSEIILKLATKYLIRITSGAAGNRITTLLDWYEHEDTILVTSTTSTTTTTTTTTV